MNTLKLAGTCIEGMGFAIPINDTKDIAEQLIQYNKVKRPYIGILGIDIDEAKSKQYNYPLGIYIRSIEAVSYTHLDVYKRQTIYIISSAQNCF